MLVGVDLRPLFSSSPTGIGNYQFYLLLSLLKHSHSPSIVGFDGRAWSAVSQAVLERLSLHSEHTKYLPLYNRIVRLGRHSSLAQSIRYHLRKRIFERSIPKELSLFHAFSYVPPGEITVPVIPVVYDLSFVRYPETHPPARLRFLEGLGEYLQRAPVVHTISHFSAREISEIFNIPRSRICVVYPGVNPIFTFDSSDDAKATLANYALEPGHYFLTVATLEPRKNLRSLIVAQSQLPSKIRQQFPLCVVGAVGWGKLNLPKTAQSLEREGSLRFLGYVSNIHLRDLYRWSRATFYPSVYEGFGMPITEALACGARVVCSNSASLPEAGGSVTRYVTPLDVAGWSKEMQKAAEAANHDSEEINARRRHSQQFNWSTAADQLLDLYRRAAS